MLSFIYYLFNIFMINKSNNFQPFYDDVSMCDLQRAYIKDISLEMPNAPEIFLKTEIPKINININVGGRLLIENIFESTITATVTASIKNEIVYLIEMTQAGIFKLRNNLNQEMNFLSSITCPNILYPYLRSNIADLIIRISMPPLYLSEINFKNMHEKKLSESMTQSGNFENGE